MARFKKKDSITYRTTLYLDYEVVKKLKEIAYQQEKTLTDLVNSILSDYLKKHTREENS